MTSKELTAIIKAEEKATNLKKDFGRFVHENMGEDITAEFAGLTFKFIEDFRSGEGDCDNWLVYFSVGEDTFEVSGWYTSHDGVDMCYCLDTMRKVRKEKVTREEYVGVTE